MLKSPANICWSWKTKNWYAEDVLKTCLEDVLKMSWRHALKTSWRYYGGKQNTYWGYLYLTNLNVYLTNLYLTNLQLTILRRIQNALSRTHHFNICLILELKQHLYFKNQNLWWLFGVVKSAEFKFDIAEKVRQ